MRLGVSIARTAVHAILLDRGRIVWAGSAEYAEVADLAEVIARLAVECGRPVRRARVVLERAVVQLRTIAPAPPVSRRAIQRYVMLETPRLFRKNGVALVTDATLVSLDRNARALWAGAADEPLVRAVLEGCTQAGVMIEALGPAADVLPRALANGARGEVALPSGEVLEIGARGVFRSRRVREAGDGRREAWVPELSDLGESASDFAAAYGAAVALPRLTLLPAALKAAHVRVQRRRAARLGIVAGILWLSAFGVYVGRVSATLHSSTTFLDASKVSVDTALALRRDLAGAQSALGVFRSAEASRSRYLALVAELTRVLGDSIYLVALRVGVDGTVRLAGYAPVAARALAALEGVLRGAKFEGPVSRERVDGTKELDRFAIVGRWEGKQ
jgi:hypothetical protein